MQASHDEGAFLDLLRLMQEQDFDRFAQALRARGPRGGAFSALAWRIDRPLLFYALALGRLDMADELLARGASLEERSCWGLSAASLCAQVDEPAGLLMLDWLDALGAARDFPACDGLGAPAVPGSGARDLPRKWWLAHCAAKARLPRLLSRLLQTPFPALDANGASLWHWLAQGCLDAQGPCERTLLCARAIADFGADPFAPDRHGLLPQDLLPPKALGAYEAALLGCGSAGRREGRRSL